MAEVQEPFDVNFNYPSAIIAVSDDEFVTTSYRDVVVWKLQESIEDPRNRYIVTHSHLGSYEVFSNSLDHARFYRMSTKTTV